MTDSCCCIEFDDYADVFQQHVVKARKEHKCIECHCKIHRGDLYQRTRMLFDGAWSTSKLCARCANVASEYMKCGHHLGELADDFELCYGFDYRDGIPKDFSPCKAVAQD